MISILKERYNFPIGFSDHSATIYAGIAAAALGAEMLEFHVVFHHDLFGPDAKASLTIEQTKNLVDGVQSIEKALAADYLKDDVSTSYPDLAAQQLANGDLGYKLSWRGNEIDGRENKVVPEGMRRGNADNNDWDVMSTMSLRVKLAK